MTIAVCLRCGEFKNGAWTTCEKCGYAPHDDESYTKHLLITEHYLSREQLEDVSAKVKAGEPIDFPQALLEQLWVKKAEVDKTNRGCVIACFIALVLVITIATAIIVWQLRPTA